MKQGEIWLVQYPEGMEHEFKNDRPALVIESNKQIERSNIFAVMAITSNLNNRLDEDINLLPDAQNHLWKDSVIKVHHIQSFAAGRFIKKIGIAGDVILSQVKEYLKVHFAI